MCGSRALSTEAAVDGKGLRSGGAEDVCISEVTPMSAVAMTKPWKREANDYAVTSMKAKSLVKAAGGSAVTETSRSQ